MATNPWQVSKPISEEDKIASRARELMDKRGFFSTAAELEAIELLTKTLALRKTDQIEIGNLRAELKFTQETFQRHVAEYDRDSRAQAHAQVFTDNRGELLQELTDAKQQMHKYEELLQMKDGEGEMRSDLVHFRQLVANLRKGLEETQGKLDKCRTEVARAETLKKQAIEEESQRWMRHCRQKELEAQEAVVNERAVAEQLQSQLDSIKRDMSAENVSQVNYRQLAEAEQKAQVAQLERDKQLLEEKVRLSELRAEEYRADLVHADSHFKGLHPQLEALREQLFQREWELGRVRMQLAAYDPESRPLPPLPRDDEGALARIGGALKDGAGKVGDALAQAIAPPAPAECQPGPHMPLVLSHSDLPSTRPEKGLSSQVQIERSQLEEMQRSIATLAEEKRQAGSDLEKLKSQHKFAMEQIERLHDEKAHANEAHDALMREQEVQRRREAEAERQLAATFLDPEEDPARQQLRHFMAYSASLQDTVQELKGDLSTQQGEVKALRAAADRTEASTSALRAQLSDSAAQLDDAKRRLAERPALGEGVAQLVPLMAQWEELRCPVCADVMTNPTSFTVNCNHTFCKQCVVDHLLEKESKCPTCRVPGMRADLRPNQALASFLERMTRLQQGQQ